MVNVAQSVLGSFSYLSLLSSAIFALSACGTPPDVRAPAPEVRTSVAINEELWRQAREVFQHRCVVCHGCYDAPCQIKLESFEGIERGGSRTAVYDPSRLTAATPTRLGVDATGVVAWRELGFYPILPEGSTSDPRASLLLRSVALGLEHPLPEGARVGDDYQLGVDRKHACPRAEEYDAFAREHPAWGMPFALPPLTQQEQASLVEWVRAGAPHAPVGIERERTRQALVEWEAFLNQDSKKGQLVARYIYEHLSFATLRFDDGSNDEPPELFRLVRSSTRENAVDEVNSRRPFDDPGTGRVYYRFVRRPEFVVDKTLMPYALSPRRLARYRQLFFEVPYEVTELPSYEPELASNPFRTFAALPVTSRYRFMLEEAQFTLMGFIKGPVCRGQVALSVIDDRFFVFFVDPKSPWLQRQDEFLAQSRMDQEMPAASGSNAWPTMWLGYGDRHAEYVTKKAEFLERAMLDGLGVDQTSVWDGDGRNDNAALTVFRHFDSATVTKGLVGPEPKTVWLMDYPLLERIHYLLVAGFDVFGNVTHQLATRMYMDYLRMEAEAGFLALLPVARRKSLVDDWYRGIDGERKTRIEREPLGYLGEPNIEYSEGNAKRQALAWLRQRVAESARHDYELGKLHDARIVKAAWRLADAPANAATAMPEVSLVVVDDEGQRSTLTILRDSGHSNIAELFDEDERRLPNEDELVVVNGVLGAYPNALFSVRIGELEEFVAALVRAGNDQGYAALRKRFGVQRTDPAFWRFSDQLQSDHLERSPLRNGLLDYTRLNAD